MFTRLAPDARASRRLARAMLFASLLSLALPLAAQTCGGDVGGGADPAVLFADGFGDARAAGGDPSTGSGGPVAPGHYTDAYAVGAATKPLHWRVPPGYVPGTPRPVLVILHGYGGAGAQNQQALAMRNYWAATADAYGVFLLAPVASGGQGGWIEADKLSIEAAIAALESRYTIDRSRRYLWGFSAGGHFAHVPALDPPMPFAAYAVNAGTLEAYAMPWTQPSTAAWRIPASLSIGLADATVPPAMVRRDRDRFLAAGWTEPATLRYVEFAGGHTVPADQLAPTLAFLCGHVHP